MMAVGIVAWLRRYGVSLRGSCQGPCLNPLPVFFVSSPIPDYERRGQALIGDPVSLPLVFFPLSNVGEGQGEGGLTSVQSIYGVWCRWGRETSDGGVPSNSITRLLSSAISFDFLMRAGMEARI